MTTRFPSPNSMAELASTIVRTINDLHRLADDLDGAAAPAAKLILDAHDYARAQSWPEQWGQKPIADDASREAYRVTRQAASHVQSAIAPLDDLAATVKRAAQSVAEAGAVVAARQAAAAKLRG